MAKCPECEAEVELKADTEAGELLSCPDCGLELEVKSTSPAKLEKAPEEEEDWGQ
jgi:alpha-aminoadipate/glutamate carrier protein LysW